jgi:hypothetical protein
MATAETKNLVVQPQRLHFSQMLVKNPNYFGNIPGSKLKPVFKLISDTSYEQVHCIGYNPSTTEMEAIFSVKRPTGYGGNLCTDGSKEFVRFYLDFHDGAGFIDQGIVAVNVHDIPSEKDCYGDQSLPLIYAATLKKKTTRFAFCTNPSLPTLRAILSWNTEPPANSPNWLPVWGNTMDCTIQLKTFPKLIVAEELNLANFLELAVTYPHLTVKDLSEHAGLDMYQLNPQPLPPGLPEIAEHYAKLKIPASRFAYKTVLNMVKYPQSELTLMNKNILSGLKINVDSIIDELIIPIPVDTTKANVDYEELECLGLDYNTESLVATVKIKKEGGYGGDLCRTGSREYIAFWIDWKDQCKWQYLNTVELRVHDINRKMDEPLCYSVSLPLDATMYRKLCTDPNLVRVRAVLSWSTPPSTTDPNRLEHYGNRVDSHVQIKPGFVFDGVKPLFNIIGGIDVDHVDDISGRTLPGSFFAYNGHNVPTGAPFGGTIVINGPSFPGYKYRFRITNLVTSASYYLSNSFNVVGWSPVPPYAPITTQTADPSNYYNFLPFNANTLNVLARFNPGTEDLLKVEMEVFTIAGTFVKRIQMDNTWPDIKLQVDDGGDCTHYTKGQTITGHFYVNDANISSWSFGSTWGGGQAGNVNTGPMPGTAFSIPTLADAYPCGAISLYAIDKTIVNSQGVGHDISTSYNVCLQEP